MDFIEGKTFFDSNEELTDKEIRFLAKQAALINSVKIRPKLIEDEWSVTNFLKEFRARSKALPKEDFEQLEPLIRKFKDMRINELPHCFVHGDILKTNVIKDKNGKLWVIDFSVSNVYPRIQELAVIACNLCLDENKKIYEKNINSLIEEYQRVTKLTEKEIKTLPTYIELSHAMHVLCANYEKIIKGNNSIENEYWISQGKLGLKLSS